MITFLIIWLSIDVAGLGVFVISEYIFKNKVNNKFTRWWRRNICDEVND